MSHFWQIDDAGKYTLSQNLSYSMEDGTFPYTNLGLSEYLRMQHTDYFETGLQYNYNDQEYFTTSTKTQQAIASFTHRLFESLTTHGQAGGFDEHEFVQFHGRRACEQFGFVVMVHEYRRDVYKATDAGRVRGESRCWIQPVGQRFGRKLTGGQQYSNVQRSAADHADAAECRSELSIAVFNASGTRRYIPNQDYTVRQVGRVTQIFRTFTSDITPGQTVRLDYNVLPVPGYTADTTTLAGEFGTTSTRGRSMGWGCSRSTRGRTRRRVPRLYLRTTSTTLSWGATITSGS